MPATTAPPRADAFLDVYDIIAYLKVSRSTIERLLSCGRFPRPDLRVGRVRRWRLATIHKWVDAGGKV